MVTGATWNQLAPGWERWHEHLDRAYEPVRAWLLEELLLRSGDILLELAAGTGSAGFDALADSGGRTLLICTDLAVEMVAAARRRGATLGRRNVEFAVVNAEHIPLAADTVDRLLCESGFMLMPDPGTALGESRRVLRAGGRIVLSVWGPPEDNPWDTIGDDILIARGHLSPRDQDSAGARMSREHDARTLLHEAGFGDIHSAHVPVRFTFDDLDEWERWTISTNHTGPVIRELSPNERAAFLVHVAEALRPYRTSRGYELPGLALCLRAT